jgi:hypothetical protein
LFSRRAFATLLLKTFVKSDEKVALLASIDSTLKRRPSFPTTVFFTTEPGPELANFFDKSRITTLAMTSS